MSFLQSAFIFKDIRLRGFWMTKWNECNFDSKFFLAFVKKLGYVFVSIRFAVYTNMHLRCKVVTKLKTF